ASVDALLKPDAARGGEGVFSGTVPLALGEAQDQVWRLPVPGEPLASALYAGSVKVPHGAQPLLPVQGGEAITVTYLAGLPVKATDEDIAAAAAKPDAPKAIARIATAGEMLALGSNQRLTVTSLYVGGDLRLQINDADGDRSKERDSVTVAVSVRSGDKLDLVLEETESHSGVFTASVPVAFAAKPDSANQQVEAIFGDQVSLAYAEDGGTGAKLELPVAKGYDAALAAFAKRFGDDALAAKTQVRLAECFFELYKNHREEAKKLKDQKDSAEAKRLDALIADELEQGTQLLTRTIRDYAGSDEQDQLLYLLGNFEQESEEFLGAINRYQHLLASFPDSVRAPEAQYKIAQCYEELKRFDEAWDAYIRLAYRWPKHELVGDAMVRIGLYYRNRAKGGMEEAKKVWAKRERVNRTAGDQMPVPPEVAEDLSQAAAVYGKFVERFPDHALIDKIALAQGDCYYQAGDYLRAIKVFDKVAEKYPASAAKGLYWAGCAALEAGQIRNCFMRYSMLLQSYPESTEAKYARGKLKADPRLEKVWKAQ
nr:tetratricopeptide repeat protein [Planctomycetota bacterium]